MGLIEYIFNPRQETEAGDCHKCEEKLHHIAKYQGWQDYITKPDLKIKFPPKLWQSDLKKSNPFDWALAVTLEESYTVSKKTDMSKNWCLLCRTGLIRRLWASLWLFHSWHSFPEILLRTLAFVGSWSVLVSWSIKAWVYKNYGQQHPTMGWRNEQNLYSRDPGRWNSEI